MKKIIGIVGLLITITASLNAVVWGNGVCKLFDACTNTSSGTGEKSIMASISISDLEVQAASNFYFSQQGYKEFLRMVERSYTGTQVMDTYTLFIKLNAVCSSIDATIAAYQSILQEVSLMSLNKSVSYSLQVFDYQKFGMERGLVDSIFQKVEELLKSENPANICLYIIEKSTEIRTLIIDMKSKYSRGVVVEMAKVWKVNQLFSSLDLTGQYISMVLASI